MPSAQAIQQNIRRWLKLTKTGTSKSLQLETDCRWCSTYTAHRSLSVGRSRRWRQVGRVVERAVRRASVPRAPLKTLTLECVDGLLAVLEGALSLFWLILLRPPMPRRRRQDIAAVWRRRTVADDLLATGAGRRVPSYITASFLRGATNSSPFLYLRTVNARAAEEHGVMDTPRSIHKCGVQERRCRTGLRFARVNGVEYLVAPRWAREARFQLVFVRCISWRLGASSIKAVCNRHKRFAALTCQAVCTTALR